MRSVETVLALVMVATVVATFARRLSIPAPSLLVVVGVGVGLIPGVPDIRVTPDVVSLVVLPPLIYAAGEELPWRDLRQVWRPVTVLAVGLVAASAVAVALVAGAVTPLDTAPAFVLGAILASTDPVAVTALARRLSLPARVQALVQAESLFNDATSLILFKVAVSVAVAGGSLAWGHVAGQFAQLAGGGAAAGAVVAVAVGAVRRRTEDPVLETVIALATPYLAYVLGEAIGGSGVTAVVVASVALGTVTSHRASADIRLQIEAVYATVVFLLESVVFALIGLQLPILIRHLPGGEQAWPFEALAVAGTLLAVRILWVFPLSLVMGSREAGRAGASSGLGRAAERGASVSGRGTSGSRPHLAWQVPAVVSWAGARGVIPLAAALSIPLTARHGVPFADRDLLQLLATMVIVVTLVVQGFSLAPLVRRAGLNADPATVEEAEGAARLHLARAALAHLEQLDELEAAPAVVVDQLRRGLQARIDHLEAGDDRGADPSVAALFRRVRHDLIAVERLELARLYAQGHIDDSTRRSLQRQLDLEQSSLQDPD
jgi:monovalent cation/hydrogen antiporter